MEHLLHKVIKRRNRPSYEPPKGEKAKEETKKKEEKKEEEEEAESEEEDEENEQPEWVMCQDPQGNICWQSRKTGQVTYGNSYGQPAAYNQGLAQRGFDDDDDDEEEKKEKKPAPAPAPVPVPAPVPAIAPVAVMHPGHHIPHPAAGVGYVQSPVHHPMGYMPSPVHYGMSPVAMYPTAPWNAMPVSPVPVQVPEYVKKQHAEAVKAKKKQEEAKKKKAEEEKKRIAAGVWERFYTDDGNKYWQHSVTGKKVSQDPYY